MNKKGLSEVITTILIILVVIVAVLIVWAVVRGIIINVSENTELRTLCTQVSYQFIKTSAQCVNSGDNDLISIDYQRGSDNLNANAGEVRVNIIVGPKGSIQQGPDPNGRITTNIVGAHAGASGDQVEIKIAPVLKTKEGKDFNCEPTDTMMVICPAETTTPQCSDTIDNDGDSFIDYGTAATNDPECTSAADNDESA